MPYLVGRKHFSNEEDSQFPFHVMGIIYLFIWVLKSSKTPIQSIQFGSSSCASPRQAKVRWSGEENNSWEFFKMFSVSLDAHPMNSSQCRAPSSWSSSSSRPHLRRRRWEIIIINKDQISIGFVERATNDDENRFPLSSCMRKDSKKNGRDCLSYQIHIQDDRHRDPPHQTLENHLLLTFASTIKDINRS